MNLLDEIRNLDYGRIKNEKIKLLREKIPGKAILGISGGLDSTVVLYLLKEAVGNENIIASFLPSNTTPQEDYEHIELIAKTVGIEYKIVDIEPIVNAFLKEKEAGNIAKGNVYARTRMTLLYLDSNENNGRVIGTGNKSEVSIGYFTLHGDGAADVYPLSDLYKTQIRELARYLKIPDFIIKKKPTAGLWVGQTDEDEIRLSYDTLDQLLYLIQNKNLEKDEILKKDFEAKDVDNVLKRIENSVFKRKYLPRD